ncbi:FecR domain-containing protein [Methylobacillus caricis]|uniref:FecR family protein n=1 Tax=Methylobacillus caricis TaxID=1971611 RepID=UPI001CFFC6A2|nr:FecR domain-containing protein [Methylobacillus caricis]MCB5187933.1 FecR domain-containing protein [Methylobacillus caricis]
MSSNPTLRAAREAAIKWFVQMQDADIEHPKRSRFEEWLLSHPSHQQAYREVCSLWEDLDSPEQLFSLASAMQQKEFIEKADRRKKIHNVVTRTLSVMFFAATGIIAYYSYDAWQTQPTMHMVAKAEIGQIRSQVLEDGSKIVVNANSDIEITYYRKQRLVKLNSGEVSFDVAKNPDRPFVVESGPARITVLGTRFAVNRFQKKVRVSVDHGTVRVEPQSIDRQDPTSPNRNAENVLTLRDNEVAEISLDGKAKRIQRPAADAFSFESGIITFDQAGLEEIAETLSRYRKPSISAQTAQGQDASITAVIQARNIESFIMELPSITPVKVEHHATETTLSVRQNKKK